MKTIAFYLTLVLLGCWCLSVSAVRMADTPWPRYHRDAQSTGCTPSGTPFFIEPYVVWQATVGVNNREENQSTPLIGNDGIYVGSNTAKVYKFDPLDGNLIWLYDSNPATDAGGIQACGVLATNDSGDENFLFQATGYDLHPDNHFFKLDTATGAVLWSDHYTGFTGDRHSLSSANMDSAGNVYMAVGRINWSTFSNWQMRKYDSSGNLLWWQQPSPEKGGAYGVGAPSALSQDETISYWCSSEDLKIWALNNDDGSIRWSYKTEKYFWAAGPAVNSQGIVYAANDFGRLFALNGDTGDLLWSLVLVGTGRTDVNSVPALREYYNDAGHITRIYVGSNGSIHCIEDDGSGQGKQKWFFDITEDHSGAFSYSGPVVTQDGAIYISSPTDGYVYALYDKGNTGVMMWRMPVYGGIKGTRGISIDIDGALYVNSRNGVLYKLHGTVALSDQLTIINESPLPAIRADVPVNIDLAVFGGQPPYEWSVVTGSLPPDCILDASTGVITGRPSNAGSFSFTIEVSDSSSPMLTTSKEFTWEINHLPLEIITISARNGKVGEPYDTTVFKKIGTRGPFHWSLSSGSIPPGLSLNKIGEEFHLVGTPAANGIYNFGITVDGEEESLTFLYKVEISDISPWKILADDPCLFPFRDAVTPPPANTPMKRYNPGAVVANGLLYVISGNGIAYYDGAKTYGAEKQATFTIYNPVTDTWDSAFWRDWSALANEPGGYLVNGQPPGYNANSVEEKPIFWMGTGSVLNQGCAYDYDGDSTEEVFLFGGNSIFHGSGAIYDPDTNKWSYGAAKPRFWTSGYYAMLHGVVDNIGADMYLFGGIENGPGIASAFSKQLMKYNAETWVWTLLSPAPVTFARHIGNIVDGKFYVMGGRQGSTPHCSNVYAYDIATDTWISGLSPMPVGVNVATSVVCGKYIIVLGGESATSPVVSYIQIYDTENDSWALCLLTIPVPSLGFAAGIINDEIIIANGSLSSVGDEQFTNSAYSIPVRDIMRATYPEIIRISLNEAGKPQLEWHSYYGIPYVVESASGEYSSDMTWTPVSATLYGQTGTTVWTHTTSEPYPNDRYYRVRRK